jgi:segregation and condensation protein A
MLFSTGEIVMSLNIKVRNFEGPFDLLLHLIKKSEMDIYDIRIYEITNQYLSILDDMKEMDLEITSEFILVAATLLEIKSKMLLPKEKNKKSEEEEIDPRKQLMDRLIEYKKFKVVAEYLRSKKDELGTYFTKKPEIIEERHDSISNEDILKGITMLDLYNLYNELINRYMNKINTENIMQTQIPMDKYKIEDKMEELKQRFITKTRVNFSEVVLECKDKLEVVVSFLAMLELIKLRTIKVIQENNFKDIYIERITTNER